MHYTHVPHARSSSHLTIQSFTITPHTCSLSHDIHTYIYTSYTGITHIMHVLHTTLVSPTCRRSQRSWSEVRVLRRRGSLVARGYLNLGRMNLCTLSSLASPQRLWRMLWTRWVLWQSHDSYMYMRCVANHERHTCSKSPVTASVAPISWYINRNLPIRVHQCWICIG